MARAAIPAAVRSGSRQTGCPVVASHQRSRPSASHASRRRPPSAKATARTAACWGQANVGSLRRHRPASQKCGRPARSKIASVPLPEESNARGPTKSALVSRESAAEHGGPASRQVPVSQECTAPSSPRATSARPSGRKASSRAGAGARSCATGRASRADHSARLMRAARWSHHPWPRPPAAGCAPARASPADLPLLTEGSPVVHREFGSSPDRLAMRPPRVGVGQGLRDGLGLGRRHCQETRTKARAAVIIRAADMPTREGCAGPTSRRSTAPVVRARIGWPRKKPPRSSARASAPRSASPVPSPGTSGRSSPGCAARSAASAVAGSVPATAPGRASGRSSPRGRGGDPSAIRRGSPPG